jgi:hypothetical protein
MTRGVVSGDHAEERHRRRNVRGRAARGLGAGRTDDPVESSWIRQGVLRRFAFELA